VLQEKTSNSHELLQSKAVVVSVMVKGVTLITSCAGWGDERKRTADDASKVQAQHRNQGGRLIWEEHGGNLFTGHAVSGVEAA